MASRTPRAGGKSGGRPSGAATAEGAGGGGRCSCEARITELEIRLTYQDDLIATLNQVVVELRKELETVAKSVVKLEQQLLAGMPEEAANEPPPHY